MATESSRFLTLVVTFQIVISHSFIFFEPRYIPKATRQPFRPDCFFCSAFVPHLLCSPSTLMDLKIRALCKAAGDALEKAQKVLPRDAHVRPDALRCEYPCRVLFDYAF